MTPDVPLPAPTSSSVSTAPEYDTARTVAEREHISVRAARRYLRRHYGAGIKLFDIRTELWPAALVRQGIERDKARLNGGWQHAID